MKLLLIFCIVSLAVVVRAKLEEKFQWKQLAFNWPNKETEKAAINSGEYVVENNLPLGLERWHNKLFITVPRWKSGVASSLNYVDLNSKDISPKLTPYPSWEANHIPTKNSENWKLKDKSTIVSTFRIQADNCDRLWVLDTGLADILGEAKQLTENAIVIFNLKTDKLIRRFVIPRSQVKEDSFFANIVVDSDRSECSNAFAYVPDFATYAVIVYSLLDDASHRVTHNFFHFDPLQGDFNVDGVNFQYADGVFGMAIGPIKPDHSKDIYFHAFTSTDEFKVSSRVLQNKTLATSPDAYHHFKYVGNRGLNGQSNVEVYDRHTGVIFYNQVNKDAIACWNVKDPYTAETQGLIDWDPYTLVFPNDLKIDSEGTIWVLSDKMSTFLLKQLNPAVINYRVLIGNTRTLIEGTPCQNINHQSPSYASYYTIDIQ